MFAPGELVESDAPQYGFRNERLPKHYQDVARSMVQKTAQIDMFARIEEVKRAGEQRFYWRSMFDIYFDEANTVWTQPGHGESEGDTGDIPLTYGFNIYQQFGRGFITEVGVTPSLKFISPNQDSPDSNRVVASADALRRKIEYQNKMDVTSKQTARLMWTDGRVGFYSRWVCDGAKFGYEDEKHVDEAPEGLGEGGDPPPKKPRQPKGGEMITPYGVLELKVPINMREISQFPFLQLSFEIDITSAKSMYPWIAQSVSGGQPGPGEYNFDRTTRLAVTQGIRLLTQTGDTIAQTPTWQRTWIRPSFFACIEDEDDRTFFYSNFPDGMLVAFVGETYAESRNESMDDHWSLVHPLEGDGQATPSCGYILMPVQDCCNDLTDLKMEHAMKAIPALYGDKGLFDFSAMSKEKAGPGAHWPTKRELDPTEDINHKIFAEPFNDLPQGVQAFYKDLMTTIPQGLTGIYPATLGDADPNNETKGGILALRDASRGQNGPAWQAFRSAYACSMEQCIRIGAYFRASEAEDGKVTISSPGAEETIVDLEDLHVGNYYCVADGDEAYPKTQTDRVQSFTMLVTAATAGNQNAIAILNEPKNAVIFKDVVAIPGLVVPGADESDKQLAEIKQLLAETPIPNQQAMVAFQLATLLARASGKPAPPQPKPEQLFRPSVLIDEDFDIHAIEFKAGQDWLNSSTGIQAKVDNPPGVLNVRLHLLMHKAAMDAAKQGAAKEALMVEAGKAQAKASGDKPKSPAESINFKDLGPSGKLQVGKQAGLDLTADAAADMASENLPQPAPQQPTE